MAVVRRTNRRGLEPWEIAELKDTEEEYERARSEALAAYNAAITLAADRRAGRIFAVIDDGGRSTQGRVAEELDITTQALTDLRRRWKARCAPQSSENAPTDAQRAA